MTGPFVLRALNTDERVALEQGLALASRLAQSDTQLTADQVQLLYDNALERDEPVVETLIAIGLAFGALIVDGREFEWARIIDEWGDETCVAIVGKMSHCAPISMIQKRIGRGESLSVAEMRDGTVNLLRDHARKAADR